MFDTDGTIGPAISSAHPALLNNQPVVLPTASPLGSERPVDRCPRCRLVQYRTSQNRCRRCYFPLAVPVAAPPVPDILAPAPRPDVANGVKCWRRMRGLTQKQLAVASHLPRTYISRIENGRITPGLVTLDRVAGALGVALPVLLVLAPHGRNGNGNANGNGHANGNGNGNGGNGFPYMAPPAGNGRIQSSSLEADACLREILRYSGILTGAQRRQVLFRVRELVAPHLTMSH